MSSTIAILVVFFIGAVIGGVGWITYVYTVSGYGEIERSILSSETYNREYDD